MGTLDDLKKHKDHLIEMMEYSLKVNQVNEIGGVLASMKS